MFFRFFIIVYIFFCNLLLSQEKYNNILTEGNNPFVVLNNNKKWSSSYVHLNTSYSLNTTPIINSLFGVEMGIDYFFTDDMKIVYGSGLYLHNPLDSKNKNQDFISYYPDFKTQYFIATTFNFVFYYYKNLTPDIDMFFSGGFELLFTNGQSVRSKSPVDNNGTYNILLAKPYFFMYLYPQIGINFINYNIEFFLSYNHSLNTQYVYFNYFSEQEKYRLQFFTFGIRFLIPFIS